MQIKKTYLLQITIALLIPFTVAAASVEKCAYLFDELKSSGLVVATPLNSSDREIQKAILNLLESFSGDVTEKEIAKGLSAFKGRSLDDLQNDSLLAALEAHGYNSKIKNGRSALEEVSRANLARLQENYTYVSTGAMKKAEDVVSHMNFYFVHNTHILSARPKIPVLSSKRIEKMGLSGTANTYEFNRDFMKTDDNVFFRVEKTMNKKIKKDLKSPYGKRALVIDSRYAEEHGWISAYIMYAGELGSAVDTIDSSQWKAFKSLLATKYPNAISLDRNFSELNQKEPKALLALRNQLYKLDFTVADFTNLYRERYLFFLNQLLQKSPKEFEKALKQLAAGRRSSVDDEVNKSFGYQRFEFKIPVAVPPEYIDIPR